MTVPPSSSTRVRGVLRAPATPYLAVFLVFLLGRALLLIGGEVFTARDTYVYAYREDPAFNLGPLVSFVGNAPRPWGLPLFYAIFPDDQWRAVGQWAFATFAWTLLAVELARHMRTRLAGVGVFAAVLLLALMTNVASWDFAILTESMSTSIGVVVFALLLRWLRTGSTLWLALMTVAAVWWTFIRPDIRIFIAVLIVILVWFAWRAWRGRTASPTDWRRAVGGALVAGLVLTLGIAWYSAITPRMMETFRPYDGDAIPESPLQPDEQLYVFRLRIDAAYEDRMWSAFKTKLGMPTCAELDEIRKSSEWRSVEWARAYTRCPDLVAWVQEQPKGALFWSRLATEDPALFARKFTELVSLTLGGEAIANVPQVVPAPVENLGFPSRRYGLAVVVLGLGVALAAALVAGAHRTHRRLFLASVGLAVVAVGSAVATVVMHSGEYARFGVQETLATRISMIMLLACALDAWWARRRGADNHSARSTESAANG